MPARQHWGGTGRSSTGALLVLQVVLATPDEPATLQVVLATPKGPVTDRAAGRPSQDDAAGR